MYGLKRIIQIDGFIANKRTEVKVDGHSILDGTNGAGKSTTLRLIAFFYGSDPTQMDTHAAGREPFVQFYLPRQSSLVVFEYERESGPCCAVVYRHKSGTKHAYRFLEAGFSEEAFSRINSEGERVYIKGHGLKLHWRQSMGLNCSQQIEIVTDYRAVIQNDSALLNRLSDSSKLKQMAFRYCLGSRKTHMRHIERICASIASRSGNLERMKDMIADIMVEDGVSFPATPIHKSDANLPAEIRSIRKFEGEAPSIREAISLGREREDIRRQLKSYGVSVNAVRVSVSTSLSEEGDAESSVNKEISTANAAYHANYQELVEARSKAESKVNVHSDRQDALQNQYDDYESRNMDEVAADYSNIASFEEAARDCESRYMRLIEDVKQEESELNRHLHKEEARYSRKREKLQIELNAAKDEKRVGEVEHAESRNKIHERKAADKEDSRARREPEKDRLRDVRAQAVVMAENGGPTEDERTSIAKAQSLAGEAKRKLSSANTTASHCNDKFNSTKITIDSANDDLTGAKRRLAGEREGLDDLHKIIYADDGTWLKCLRDEDPAWTSRIGKIVNPELLQRKDLSAVFEESGEHDCVFGWNVNLDAIPAPHWTKSEEQLRSEYTALEESVMRAQKRVESFDAVCTKASKAHKAAEKARDNSDHALRVATSELATASSFVEDVRLKIDSAVSARRSNAKSSIELLDAEMKELDGEIAQAISDIDALYAETMSDLLGSWALEKSRLEISIDRIDDSIEDELKSHKLRVKTLESDFSKMCSNKGIDEKTIYEAKLALDQSAEKVATLHESTKDVAAYNQWLKTEWAARKGLAEEAEVLKREFSNRNNLVDEEKTAHGRKLGELKAALADITARKSDLQDRLSAIRNLSPRIDGFIPSEQEEVVAQDMPFDILISHCTDMLDSYSAIRDKLLRTIKSVDGNIDNYGETQISKAWARSKQECANINGISTDEIHDDRFVLLLPDALQTFIDDEFSAIRMARIESLRGIGKGFTDFFEKLSVVHSGIRAQANKITGSIKDNSDIAALSAISLLLSSRVEELDYWGTLQDFTGLWNEWRESNDGSLPEEALLEDMEKLITSLQSMKSGRHLRDYFDLHIRMVENGQEHIITSDNQMDSTSSTGLMYLALCVIFIAISRALCPDPEVKLHWPVDELGVLHGENISRLFGMLNKAGIIMVGGFPSEDPTLLRHFQHRQVIDFKKGIRVIDIPMSTLKERAMSRLASDAEGNDHVE